MVRGRTKITVWALRMPNGFFLDVRGRKGWYVIMPPGSLGGHSKDSEIHMVTLFRKKVTAEEVAFMLVTKFPARFVGRLRVAEVNVATHNRNVKWWENNEGKISRKK